MCAPPGIAACNRSFTARDRVRFNSSPLMAAFTSSVLSTSARPGALRSRSDVSVTGSGQGTASCGSSKAIVTSSDGSCSRSIRYDVSAVSVSAWKPCAQPAGTYSVACVSPDSSTVARPR
ncbi:hypothetical protein STENM223S_11571 [Streptomyces tendae]